MITDFDINHVWISNITPPDFKEKLEKTLSESNVRFSKLINTKDWYCRDYMPVQINDNDFIQFVFYPAEYHKTGQYGYITNPISVQLSSKGVLQPRFSRIILDGGNIIKSQNRVIITDKVIEDNLYQFNIDRSTIISELESVLECEVIIIPRYSSKYDKTGHADGLLRFITDEIVLINNVEDETEKEWLDKFLKVLLKHNLDFKEVYCGLEPGDETATGLYINYLQVGKLIIVPQFGIDGDDRAFNDIIEAYGSDGGYIFKQMDARSIAKNGGALNCATWTIKSS